MRKVNKIKPKNRPLFSAKKKVAAYVRVSSAKESMLHSLAAQVSYYSKFIQSKNEWEYVGVYADEAITGTKKMRPEFQRMILDCRNNKIDIIVTKSISRFARNTITLLETVRELKLIGVDVFFEEENIHSISHDGELLLTILASYAQEESLSVSQNCKWRVRNSFKEGKTNSMTMLGYRFEGEKIVIVPEEADIVRMIFNSYLKGMGKNAIMKKLHAAGKVTRHKKAWTEEGVRRILKNERFTGVLLLQKTYVSDHLTKKRMVNNGQLPKYYVADSHEAIIDKEMFQKVQEEMERRQGLWKNNNKTQLTYPFTSKIICGICGKKYRRRITNSTTPYKNSAWICSTFKDLGKKACPSKQIPENILYSKSAEVLGLKNFDLMTFNKEIYEIKIVDLNKIQFIFRDGNILEQTWKR